jgi:hypothetical protein
VHGVSFLFGKSATSSSPGYAAFKSSRHQDSDIARPIFWDQLRAHELLKPEGLVITVTPCLRDKLSFLVGMQIKLVQVLCGVGIIPIPIRRLKSIDVDGLIENGNFQIVDTEKIYAGASSYFVAAKKA